MTLVPDNKSKVHATSRSRRRFACAAAVAMIFCAIEARPSYAVATCSIASGATLAFGLIVALESTGPVIANSGGTFWVSCTSDVSASPALYSTTERTLRSGNNSLPFLLSTAAPGGIELPTGPAGQPLAIVRNGTPQPVTLYGKVLASDFKVLPSGTYAGSITLTLEY